MHGPHMSVSHRLSLVSVCSLRVSTLFLYARKTKSFVLTLALFDVPVAKKEKENSSRAKVTVDTCRLLRARRPSPACHVLGARRPHATLCPPGS